MANRREEDGSYSWTTEYEKTWEVLQEDEEGSLQATIDDIIQKARRKRLLIRRGNVRLGMMRHLFIILDMSKSMEESDLLKPSRLACSSKLLEYFVMEYFDQNPISQIGILGTKNKRSEKISEMSGNPKLHISNLQQAASKGCLGEPSLQNALETAIGILRHVPSHTSREILIIFGSLTTCDPGDIFETIKSLKDQSIRCSVIGLSAEVRICKKVCQETQGTYGVVLDERHFKDLLLSYVRPPEAKVNSEASLIRMGFPIHTTTGAASFCMCHLEMKQTKGFGTGGYFCPQCRSKYCELPVECKICGLTLVCAPHLARSYQHLFPLAAFVEMKTSELSDAKERVCCGCQVQLSDQITYVCPTCEGCLCSECDIFTHETLHICPGCASQSTCKRRNSLDQNGT